MKLALTVVMSLMLTTLGIAQSNSSAQPVAKATPTTQPVAAPSPASARVADPFQAKLEAARAAEAAWQAKDDDLDTALSMHGVCDPEAHEDVKGTLTAKRAEIAAWIDYYGSHLSYQRDRAKVAGGTLSSRAAQRADLLNAIQIEERELTDLKRRLADLEATLTEKGETTGTTGAPKAVESLRSLSSSKQLGLAKLKKALMLFDEGAADLTEIRELANTRMIDIQALLNSMKVETTLYDNLYTGFLHRLDLKCDKETPTPTQHDAGKDWEKRTTGRMPK